MKYFIFSCVLTVLFILYNGNSKEQKESLPDDILSEQIVEHRFLYQNGKIIEMTKKIVKMKRTQNDNNNKSSN
jgi:hypothetical protein